MVKVAGPVRVLITGAYPFEVLQGGKVLSRASRRHGRQRQGHRPRRRRS
jgi:hypothetical protein